MNTPRPEEPWTDPELEPIPRPWYKRPRVAWVALAIILFFIFVFSQGHQPEPHAANTNTPIAVVQPYTPVVSEAKAVPSPPSVPTPQPTPPPAPQINLPPRLPPSANAPQTVNPAFLSYAAPPPPPVSKPAEPAEPAHTGIKFATATLPGTKASPAIDDTYVLMPGLLFMVLDTAIDSNLPGPLLAHLPGPVYSPKGTVLMEAETQIMGRYVSLTHNGSQRLQAVSTFAHTPKGIWVPLADEPMSDDLGRTGLPGEVNNRYFERFGGAVLLDLAQSALAIVQADLARGGSTYLSFNSTDSLASQILREQVTKPPIFTKHAGETIALWITQPISFADSYRNRIVGQ